MAQKTTWTWLSRQLSPTDLPVAATEADATLFEETQDKAYSNLLLLTSKKLEGTSSRQSSKQRSMFFDHRIDRVFTEFQFNTFLRDSSVGNARHFCLNLYDICDSDVIKFVNLSIFIMKKRCYFDIFRNHAGS